MFLNMNMVRIELLILINILRSQASDDFSIQISFSISKNLNNFIMELSTTRLKCLVECLRKDCSYAIYSDNSLCELFNSNVLGVNNISSTAFVRNGR